MIDLGSWLELPPGLAGERPRPKARCNLEHLISASLNLRFAPLFQIEQTSIEFDMRLFQLHLLLLEGKVAKFSIISGEREVAERVE